nr:unnamed protein product [Spirometra erinaceieuropaei]
MERNASAGLLVESSSVITRNKRGNHHPVQNSSAPTRSFDALRRHPGGRPGKVRGRHPSYSVSTAIDFQDVEVPGSSLPRNRCEQALPIFGRSNTVEGRSRSPLLPEWVRAATFTVGPRVKKGAYVPCNAASGTSCYPYAFRKIWHISRDQCCLETYLAECTSDDDLICMIPYVEALLRELREELDCVGLINRNAHTPKTFPLDVSESEHVYTYYEDIHGLNIYLHSVNWRCLMTEYKDRELPRRISGTVVQIDRYSMNHDLRRRYRYLSHLPIGRPFYFVELDLQPPTVSQKTLDEMSDLLLARSHKREQQLQKELLLTLAKEEAENRIPTLPLGCRLVAHANLAEVPTDEDFVPLCQTSDVQPTKSCFRRSFASVSKVGASAVVDSHRIASFPERACNGTNRQVGYICAAEFWPSLTEAPPTPMTTSGAWGLGASVHAPHSHPVEQDPSNTDELPAPAPPLTLDKGDHDRRSRRKKQRKPDLVDLDSLAKSLSLLPVNKGLS